MRSIFDGQNRGTVNHAVVVVVLICATTFNTLSLGPMPSMHNELNEALLYVLVYVLVTDKRISKGKVAE